MRWRTSPVKQPNRSWTAATFAAARSVCQTSTDSASKETINPHGFIAVHYTWHCTRHELCVRVGSSRPSSSEAAMQKWAPGDTTRTLSQAGTSALENTRLLKELLVELFIHPYRERHYLHHPDQKTNQPSDSEGDIIFITLDYLQGRRESTFIILENKQICSLPRAALWISLNKALHTLCWGGIPKCQNYLSTLPFDVFSSDDSQVSLGVRRAQVCLLSLTSEGKSFYLIFCMRLQTFKVVYLTSQAESYTEPHHTKQIKAELLSQRRWGLSPFASLPWVRFWPMLASEHP